MSASSDTERAAADAICAVVDVTRCERLEPPGHIKTPDWRMVLADGRVADVEVTTFIDGDALGFFKALSDGGSGREWPHRRLSQRWTVFVSDHSPRSSKRLSVKELMAALCDTLVFVEALCGTPEQMAAEAEMRLVDPETFFNRHGGWRAFGAAERNGVSFEDWCASGSGYWLPELLVDYYKGNRGSEIVHVNIVGEPEPLGAGKGMVKTIPSLGDGGAGYDSLVPAIQRAIDQKTAKRQLDDAPGLKWLAVMLDGIPGFQLGDTFGPRFQPPYPTLEGISFDYFDEVWVASVHEDVVLRLSDGGRPVSVTHL